jgi:hypothetical protein
MSWQWCHPSWRRGNCDIIDMLIKDVTKVQYWVLVPYDTVLHYPDAIQFDTTQ